MEDSFIGTLAVDLGNTNTVIAFQGEKEINPVLIQIPEITSDPGVIPTAVWYENSSNVTKIGLSALKMRSKLDSEIFFHSNFKRFIGNNCEKYSKKVLSPTESGEKFFKVLWENIPKKFVVKRLILTAPIDTYKGYRKWLISLCKELPVDEIALVDEPTAAALGIKVPFGSKIMTIDIGGSTIDMNIIQVEGGEGKSAPIAELLKFKGNDVSAISKQKIKSAQIISKSGSKIGGKDIDQWIVNYFIPFNQDEKNLSKAEEIKCKLSSSEIKDEIKYLITLFIEKNKTKEFSITKKIFEEEILIKNNLLNHLNCLLKELLNEARGNFCEADDLNSIILVGGGTQIPLIKEWLLTTFKETQIKSPPPIEAIASGALAMTPGVKIKDILGKGISIRLLNKRNKKHFWHPIFCKGQTWPTEKPFELILQASKNSQNKFEIVIGETKKDRNFDVIFENGIPKLAEIQSEEEVIKWDIKPLTIILEDECVIGKDYLKLLFRITEKADFLVECFHIDGKHLGEYNLGNIY